ncbi:MAG: ribosome biogenesis GTP-binding protein YihA/YsxC [Deltaproteobacteria bacterium]|jgi:GTP-binding protein
MEITFLKSAFRRSHYPPSDKPEVAFAGRSNVGKSSLINVLVKRTKIARTSSTPGRTQAINFFSVADRFYMVDLPGYGFARVPLRIKSAWGDMVETYLRSRPNLKTVVVILDIRRDVGRDDESLLQWLNHFGIRALVVLTKADKLSRSRAASRARLLRAQLDSLSAEEPTVFSAKTKEGRKEIWEKILQAIQIGDFQGHRL